MFRKLAYLHIAGVLCLGGLLLMGCFQSNQSSSGMSLTTMSTPTPIPPTPTPSPRLETLRVNQLTASALTFQNGDFVWVQPSGEVQVGPFVGFVGPEGNGSWLLADYSIVSDIPHGALICRVKGQEEWYFCGEGFEVQSEVAGQLEFQVNDKDQSNNDPNTAFMVRIAAAPYAIHGGTQTGGQSASANSSEPDNSNNGEKAAESNTGDSPPIDDPTPIGEDDPTYYCRYSAESDSACLDLCRNDPSNPNCQNQVDYMEWQDKQDQQQRDDEERRQRQHQEDDQRRRDEEERQRQQQQQDNSSGN